MAVELVFAANPIHDRDPRLARQFEQVVADTVGAAALPPGPVQVRFHVWEGDDLPRYVCKVECPSACPMAPSEQPPWRWWSGLVETPKELGNELREALRARQARSREQRAPSPSAPVAPVERWGWAGELSLS